MQPLRVNDAAEAPNESCRLLFNLRVHPEVSHEVDVADPAGNGRVRQRFPSSTHVQKENILNLNNMNLRTCFHW